MSALSIGAERRPPVVLVAAAAVALTVVAIVLSACGGGENEVTGEQAPASAASPFDRDACELLSAAAVEEALGERVEGEFTEGVQEIAQPGDCRWEVGGSVDLLNPGPTPTEIVLFLGDEQIFNNTRVLAERGEDYEELEGTGDEAYVGGGEGGVRLGEVGITITPIGVNANDPGTRELIATLLAEAAASY